MGAFFADFRYVNFTREKTKKMQGFVASLLRASLLRDLLSGGETMLRQLLVGIGDVRLYFS